MDRIPLLLEMAYSRQKDHMDVYNDSNDTIPFRFLSMKCLCFALKVLCLEYDVVKRATVQNGEVPPALLIVRHKSIAHPHV